MDRTEQLEQARKAVEEAQRLAREAHRHAASNPMASTTLAAASAAWSDVARTHAAIAALLPDTTTED